MSIALSVCSKLSTDVPKMYRGGLLHAPAASWSDARWRADAAHVAAATASDLVELRCDVDSNVADARVERRRAMHDDPSDADRDVAAALRPVASPGRATAAGGAPRRTSREVSTEEVWP